MVRGGRQRVENDVGALDTGDVSQVTPRNQIGGTLDRVTKSGRTFQGKCQQPGAVVAADREGDDAARLEDRPS